MRDFLISRSTGLGGICRGLVLLAFALLLVPSSVFGQESDSPPDVDKETAQEVLQLLRDGKKAYEAEDYKKAHELFEEAYDKWARPEILLRLGKTAEELGRAEEALEHYRKFLDEKPDADAKPKIEEKIAGLEKELPAKVEFRSTPTGAEVFGEEGQEMLGKTPLEIEASAGEHTYVFRAEGYEEKQRTVDLEATKTKSLEVTLEEIDARAGASGEEADEEPGPRERAIAKKKTEQQHAEQVARPLATWGWMAGATGVAGIGTGVLFTVLQNGVVGDVNSYDRSTSGATRSELDSMKSQARAHHRFAVVGFAAGGALTATGAGLLIHQAFVRNSGGQERVHLTPAFRTTEGGGWAGFRLDF